MIEYLTLDDALSLIDDLGVGPIRDIGLLDSALHRPQVSVFGREAYPSVEEKAAALLESIVRSPSLANGNKRLGWLSLVVFLGLNGRVVDAPDDDAYELVVGAASGSVSLDEIATSIRQWV